ncbi:MAG: hypothetical protein K2X27_04740 [Candidatus Obscuribacterales bacterium]|nr:hypothetical protein [Candidatus Obscuribacterales bacterium]
MIWASVKMGWQDKRLLIPSILTVFTNMLFGFIFFLDGIKQMGHQAGKAGAAIQHPGASAAANHAAQMAAPPSNGLLPGSAPSPGSLLGGMQINGPTDTSGFGFSWDTVAPFFTTDNMIIVFSLMSIWWLTNRFLEGVTTAMVYSHLTEGRGSGKFSEACSAVFQSLPAIVMLGIATFAAKKIASFLRNKNHSGMLGMGFNFLAGIVEVFWTLAGHLILPAIVIEGCSFIGGLKRADKIAQGSLLTIGIGEVGVDLICRVTTYGLWTLGGAGAAAAFYAKAILSPPVLISAVMWGCALIFVTALSIYIRSAFYTCL